MELVRIHEEFPAPSYRGVQRKALDRIQNAFRDGNSIVLVQAPTGSGKSLLARAVAGCAERKGAYYTTPQVSQIDEVETDDLLSDITLIKGKRNYGCVLDAEYGTPVSKAKCARDPTFECPKLGSCPYFEDRKVADNAHITGMTLAYFLETAFSDIFGPRDVLVVDEAHGLPDWAEMHAQIEISRNTIPNWSESKPSSDIQTADEAVPYCQSLVDQIGEWRAQLAATHISPEQARIRDHLKMLEPDLQWFIDSHQEDVTTWLVDPLECNDEEKRRGFILKPLYAGQQLDRVLWERGENIVLLSATILDKTGFCRLIGLDPADAAYVTLPHTFPVENRPLYDVTQGPMTSDERKTTLPKIAEAIAAIMQEHANSKGLIHCHSYDIQKQLFELVAEYTGRSRLRKHDSDNRDQKLRDWKQADLNKVFFSVKMEEALDLEGDLCRWQVLAKAPYPNTHDPVVAERLERNAWQWYYRTTLRTIIQACGRIVRSPDDYGATYLADDSILDVFSRARTQMPAWFADQVDAIERLHVSQ